MRAGSGKTGSAGRGTAWRAGGDDWRGGQLCHDCVLAEGASCITLQEAPRGGTGGCLTVSRCPLWKKDAPSGTCSPHRSPALYPYCILPPRPLYPGAALPPGQRAAVLTLTRSMTPASFPLGLDEAWWAAGSELTWPRPLLLWPRPSARPRQQGTNKRRCRKATPQTGVDDNDYLKVRKVGV